MSKIHKSVYPSVTLYYFPFYFDYNFCFVFLLTINCAILIYHKQNNLKETITNYTSKAHKF